MADSEKYFTKLVDGQLSVATVAQSGEIIPEESRPGDKYTTALVQTDDGPQLCVKTFDLNGGGGGGGGTVDQTYDPTSTNAQSGTAVAEAVAPALKNTATGTNSLTVNGNATKSTFSINIGYNSTVFGATTVALGATASASNDGAISIGYGASSSPRYTIAIGSFAKANASGSGDGGGVAIGAYAEANAKKAIAIGGYDSTSSTSDVPKATAESAIQLGQGTNSTANSFQVYSYQLLDGNTGLIPPERLGTGYDATKTQVLKNINGVLTWVEES